MDVAGNVLEGKLGELLPAPLDRRGDHPVDPKPPLLERDLGRRAGGQDRETVFDVLSRR